MYYVILYCITALHAPKVSIRWADDVGKIETCHH